MGSSTESLPRPVGWRERVRHFTWAWYTASMSTGGIALLLAHTPHRFRGLATLGTIVYIVQLVMFVCFTATIGLRFAQRPRRLLLSLYHPTESLFFPTIFITISTILANAQMYGGPHGAWLVPALRVLFWIYVAATFVLAVGQYSVLFSGRELVIQSMTPAWLLPIFPPMMAGTIAANISPAQPTDQALPIIVGGLAMQFLGFAVFLMIGSIWLGRLMLFGLPEPSMRPGMFIAVGPPSFTTLVIIGLADATMTHIGANGTPGDETKYAFLPLMAVTVAIAIWIPGVWLFAISLYATLRHVRQMEFHLAWWAFVFPNVGFTISVINLGSALNSAWISWVGSALTCVMVAMWLFVGVMHVIAVWRKWILYPGRDEDHYDD